MKRTVFAGLALALLALSGPTWGSAARRLVILHTNDTHSQIDPDRSGAGGILQRKAVFDSVRRAEKNVIAVDAGDAVQGSLYFKMFRGDVDFPLMERVGYDIRLLGNHEFDNGLSELARHWKGVKADRLSANYGFGNTPARGLFKPWVIKKVDGVKVGFVGVNVNPESLISAANYEGMTFRPAIPVADSIATMLKQKMGCRVVVAVTHIGYSEEGKEDDVKLARASRDIDIIIGGHSHTLVDPAYPERTPFLVENAAGRPVLVAQAGKSGKYVGKIEVWLDDPDQTPAYSLIPVTDRFPEERLDRGMRDFLRPWSEKVDSVNSIVVGRVAAPMGNSDRNGSFANWTADFGRWYGQLKLDSLNAAEDLREALGVAPTEALPRLDLSVMNVGGIRSSWPEGELRKGDLLSTFPFSNRFVIIALKGSDLLEAMDIAARKGGEAISQEAVVVRNPDGSLKRMLVGGKEVDPDREYLVGTIDYLAWGNDDLRPFANGRIVWRDPQEVSAAYMRYLDWLRTMELPIEGDPRPRFK